MAGIFLKNHIIKLLFQLKEMKKALSIITAALFLSGCLQAQYYKTVTVKQERKLLKNFRQV